MMTSQVVRALERKGLLERQPHPQDGRAILLAPTAGGKDLITNANRSVEDADESFFAALGVTGTHQLTALLATLRHSHQQLR